MSFTFEEGSGFSAFALFNAIKLHFTSDSYDYFKYGGKTNVSKDTFANRKDKYTFYRLSRKYSLQELRDFYVSNFLVKDVNWVGDIANAEGEENYKLWQKRRESLTYFFKQDIIGLLNTTQSPNEMLMVKDGQYPILLKEVMQGTINIETLVILDDIMNFSKYWKSNIKDDIVFPDFMKKCESYKPFINYDKEKFKQIIKTALKEF